MEEEALEGEEEVLVGEVQVPTLDRKLPKRRRRVPWLPRPNLLLLQQLKQPQLSLYKLQAALRPLLVLQLVLQPLLQPLQLLLR